MVQMLPLVPDILTGQCGELAFGRVLLSYFASVYVRMITGMKIADATAGFKCYRRQVLEAINFR